MSPQTNIAPVVETAKPVAAIDTQKLQGTILRFISWLDRYGELSYDHQSFFASDLGRGAKAFYYRHPRLGTLAVGPMIICEALLPSARALFWRKDRFPIADAHYAMGFAFLSSALKNRAYYDRAVHFLNVLERTRCPGYAQYCWGYPFNWETRKGTIKEGTPLITTVPYVYEAFRQVYQVDGNPKWRAIMRLIADHALHDYRDLDAGPNASTCTYTPEPEDVGGVVNASAYRAFLLTCAAYDFSDDRYLPPAERNMNFVLQSQNDDGSWNYAMDGQRHFVDHFHTCFVLKALAKIEAIARNARCTEAIERGVSYYLHNLFDAHGRPQPFSRRPRLTVYRRELYDYAECINLCTLLAGRFPALDEICRRISAGDNWQTRAGFFRARQLFVGWDNTPMHRWAQSQMFRSLCFLLSSKSGAGLSK